MTTFSAFMKYITVFVVPPEVVEEVPPPLPYARIRPNRISCSALLRFNANALAYYDNAVTAGRSDEVAWMAESGYLQAIRDRAQQDAPR